MDNALILSEAVIAALSPEERSLYEEMAAESNGIVSGDTVNALCRRHDLVNKEISHLLSGRYDLSGCTIYFVRWFYPSALAQRTLFYLQTIADVYFGTSYFTVRDGITSWLFLYTVEGAGDLIYEGKEYHLLPGDVFFIDGQRMHNYRTASPEGWRYQLVHFSGCLASDFFAQVYNHRNFVFHFEQESEWYRLFSYLFEINQTKLPQNELNTHVTITQLISSILQTLPQFDVDLQPPRIRNMCVYLSEHACDALTIDSIAADFSISKFHLCREFLHYTGETIFAYIRKSRLSIAKRLLRESNYSIAEIAVMSGFENLSCFCRMFRKEENATPSGYRKEWRSL